VEWVNRPNRRGATSFSHSPFLISPESDRIGKAEKEKNMENLDIGQVMGSLSGEHPEGLPEWTDLELSGQGDQADARFPGVRKHLQSKCYVCIVEFNELCRQRRLRSVV
jgi:hypothetical protein